VYYISLLISITGKCIAQSTRMENYVHYYFLLSRSTHISFPGCSSVTYKSVTCKNDVSWQTNNITSKKRIKVSYPERVIMRVLQISNRCWLPSHNTGMISAFNFFEAVLFRVSCTTVFYQIFFLSTCSSFAIFVWYFETVDWGSWLNLGMGIYSTQAI
jgi:hypothetical protein